MSPLCLLLVALISVESGGRIDAVGDGGDARGVLQIHACVIQDVNRVYHTSYSWPEDCYDPDKSKDICIKYLSHYATEKRLGREVTDEDRARIWSGGPNGYKKKATEKYWERVNHKLQELKE